MANPIVLLVYIRSRGEAIIGDIRFISRVKKMSTLYEIQTDRQILDYRIQIKVKRQFS